MLSIRLQRVGRKGHPVYRVIVQDSHRQPTSGKIVAQVGSYDPHTKAVVIDKEKAQTYLNNGAQPTPRVVMLLQNEGVKLPKWVEVPAKDKQKSIKNTEKLRRNQPKEEAPAEDAAAVVEATPEQEVAESVTEGETVEQVAESEVADGQQTVEDETAEPAEASDEEAK